MMKKETYELLPKIILYGLKDTEIDTIRDSGLRAEYFIFDCYTDVIAHYAELTIVNPQALDAEEKACLEDFFKQIDPTDEKVIMTAEDDAFRGISFVETISDFFDYPKSIPVILMKNLKETKRDVDFSRRIMLAIKVLYLILQNPGITTRQITEKIEGISDRSVKRYIRSLQAAGMLIEYRNKGWVCDMDPREFF